jgi:hypothetical protein
MEKLTESEIFCFFPLIYNYISSFNHKFEQIILIVIETNIFLPNSFYLFQNSEFNGINN